MPLSMNKILIESQDDFASLSASVSWEDAFIKESFALTPSYLTEDSIVAPDAKLWVKVLICTPESEYMGIEFLFEEVEEFYLPSAMDLEPEVSLCSSFTDFKFLSSDSKCIRAKRILYRFRGEEYFTYGTKVCGNYFDEGGVADEKAW